MAKLVIIDDLLCGCQLIQKQFELINSSFASDSTFVFDNDKKDDNLKLVNINKADNKIILFKNHLNSVKEQLLDFIKDNSNEAIVIVIDTLLISQSSTQPTLGKYYKDEEYSDEIYKYLYELKNGKDNDKGYNLENVCFFMSFRSESSISILAQVLKSRVRKDEQTKEEMKKRGENTELFFPMEACEPENISWVLNACQSYERESKVNIQFPLIFPDEYIAFLQSKENF